jgi:hypothetical protein
MKYTEASRGGLGAGRLAVHSCACQHASRLLSLAHKGWEHPLHPSDVMLGHKKATYLGFRVFWERSSFRPRLLSNFFFVICRSNDDPTDRAWSVPSLFYPCTKFLELVTNTNVLHRGVTVISRRHAAASSLPWYRDVSYSKIRGQMKTWVHSSMNLSFTTPDRSSNNLVLS